MNDTEPAVCRRCGQNIDPLNETYLFDGHRAHIICPTSQPDLPAA